MLTRETRDSDPYANVIRTYDERIRQIEGLYESIKTYDSETNSPNIDQIFCDASRFRNRRLDFAVYKLAMQSKNGTSKQSVEHSKSLALLEVRRSLNVLKSGIDAWK